NCGAGNDYRCADIATHGVKRDSNLLRHERPGNLISCGLSARPQTLKIAMEGGARRGRNPCARPGRDNSVSAPRHNLLTPSFGYPPERVADSAHRNSREGSTD